MRPLIARVLGVVFYCGLALCSAAAARKPLEIYFVDVEGGQATLIVAPSGESLLIDTGWPGFNGRDADRIVSVANSAGLKQIDYVLITHYHRDHVGGAPQLAERIRVGTFLDHGPNREDQGETPARFADYEKLLTGANRRVMKPGDKLKLKDATLTVLTADGEHIGKALHGAGQPNPLCAFEKDWPVDSTENARSLGTLLTYGKFRFIDLGDLTKKKEVELACPDNLVGTVDVYLTTHHGLDQSNARALVHALRPRVAIMNNGARKGGIPEAWQTVHDSPGLEDMWQLHYAVQSDAAHNVAADHIANSEESCQGAYLKLSAQPDGSFTVFNPRNQASKTYAAR
ncbi:MAG TPA: MBL fold metallo-hydrolase [Terriglobales bacterium]|nr:MBL fold metallo-hydrolase [Terriglobales bacterium]